MTAFRRYVGIDYSGAQSPESSLKGLRAYLCEGDAEPVEVLPPAGGRRYWSRRGMAYWIALLLGDGIPTMIGIDHAFSFPQTYFDAHKLTWDWQHFLEDFVQHWPTHEPGISVDLVRRGSHGNGAARLGNSRWRRLTDQRSPGAKSAFHFDVPGSVAKSTHAGLPWLLYLRQQLGNRAHFWPFDGWLPAAGMHVIAEAYPAMWSGNYERERRSGDQHDAFSVACALRDADRSGRLQAWLQPALAPAEVALARVEGWILGVH